MGLRGICCWDHEWREVSGRGRGAGARNRAHRGLTTFTHIHRLYPSMCGLREMEVTWTFATRFELQKRREKTGFTSAGTRIVPEGSQHVYTDNDVEQCRQSGAHAGHVPLEFQI